MIVSAKAQLSVVIQQPPVIKLSIATINAQYVASSGIKKIQWSVTEAPNVPSLLTPNSKSLTVSRLINGVYKFSVSVTDSTDAVATGSIQMVVENVIAPVKPDTVFMPAFCPDTAWSIIADGYDMVDYLPHMERFSYFEFTPSPAGPKFRFTRKIVAIWIREEYVNGKWIEK